jgi:hypothetical protein
MAGIAALLRQRRYDDKRREEQGLPRRKTNPIRIEDVDQLTTDILSIPATSLMIPLPMARTLVELVRRLTIRQRELSLQVRRLQVTNCTLRYRRKLTDRWVEIRDYDALAQWWLARKDARGKDLHASALARQAARKRKLENPDAYKIIGTRGAEARWAAHRASQAAQVERLSSKPAPCDPYDDPCA